MENWSRLSDLSKENIRVPQVFHTGGASEFCPHF